MNQSTDTDIKRELTYSIDNNDSSRVPTEEQLAQTTVNLLNSMVKILNLFSQTLNVMAKI